MIRLRLAMLGLLAVAVTAAPLRAGTREEVTLESACEVLDALANLQVRAIPPALLGDAEGVAIIPHVLKAGFVIGARYGKGVMLVRDPNGAWARPIFLSITGGSFGWQAGVESTDLVLVFKTKRSVERVVQGKSKITLGADIGIAAGPIGRQAEAGTDAQLKAEIFSYSRSRGLFAGLSLDGAALVLDNKTTNAYYATPRGGIGPIPLTPPDAKLQMKLTTLSARVEPPVIVGPPPVVPVPPPPGVTPPPSPGEPPLLPSPRPIAPPPPPPQPQ